MTLDRSRAEDPYAKLPQLPSFEVTSTDFADGQPIPIKHAFGDAGEGAENVSPQLSWSGFPESTGSFVVTCYDPDAPTPSGFWHWLIVDIPASVTSLDAGAALPSGALGIKSDWGQTEWGGPLPPPSDPVGPHRYYFSVYAVADASLGVPAEASPAFVAFNLAFKATARGQLLGTFAR